MVPTPADTALGATPELDMTRSLSQSGAVRSSRGSVTLRDDQGLLAFEQRLKTSPCQRRIRCGAAPSTTLVREVICLPTPLPSPRRALVKKPFMAGAA